jgi:hypothetical protein
MHVPNSDAQRRFHLVGAITEAWGLTSARDAIPTRLRAGTEPVHWPLPMLERLCEIAGEMPGLEGLEEFQRAITEVYDGNREGVDDMPDELQQADLDAVSRYVEEYRRGKAKKKGKGRRRGGESTGHDDEEGAHGMQCMFDSYGTIFTDLCR